MSAGPGTILEDDQQLYDWGIENRMDQYYQVSSYIVPQEIVQWTSDKIFLLE